MKLMNEQISFPGANSIKVKMNDIPHFTFPWHAHGEYEIVYIKESTGTRYIGDSFDKFKRGDLVLIGSGLPHFYKSDAKYHTKESTERVESVVIQFPRNLIQNIGNLPEMININDLLKRAERGLIFKFDDKSDVILNICQLHAKNGIERLINIISILQQLATTNKVTYASGSHFTAEMFLEKDARLIKILNYLNRHYLQPITLQEVSKLFGMNTSAFCRYFKTKTSKTLVEYIQELRIGYACHLLTQHQISIKEVAFESGFNHMSYFNRAFKRIKGITPSTYISQITGSTKATAKSIH